MRVETEARANVNRHIGTRTECLWVSPRTWAALQAERERAQMVQPLWGEVGA